MMIAHSRLHLICFTWYCSETCLQMSCSDILKIFKGNYSLRGPYLLPSSSFSWKYHPTLKRACASTTCKAVCLNGLENSSLPSDELDWNIGCGDLGNAEWMCWMACFTLSCSADTSRAPLRIPPNSGCVESMLIRVSHRKIRGLWS